MKCPKCGATADGQWCWYCGLIWKEVKGGTKCAEWLVVGRREKTGTSGSPCQ